MKAKVIKRFRDKPTNIVYESGIYEASEKRVKQLQDLGYLESEKNDDTPKENSILDGNVGEVTKNVTDEFSKEELEDLLKEEESEENRKGVTKHINSLLEEK